MRRLFSLAAVGGGLVLMAGCDGGGGIKEGISEKAVLDKKVEPRAMPFTITPSDSSKAYADSAKAVQGKGKEDAEPAPEK